MAYDFTYIIPNQTCLKELDLATESTALLTRELAWTNQM